MTDPSVLLDLFGTERPVAFITGSGAPRVGQVIARRLAHNGYRIVVHANHSVDEAQKFCRELDAMQVDNLLVTGPVQDPDVVHRWFDEIDQKFGRVDVLINAAAIWNPSDLFHTDADSVRRHFEVNTLGPWCCAQQAARRMVDSPTGGTILFLGDWAVQRPYPKFSAYFPSKGAIETMMRSMAVELALKNPRIRVNTIHPGPIMLSDTTPDETRKAIREQCLLKRDGSPEHVASTAQFLIEHPYLTGVAIPVDGGRSIYAGGDSDAIAHPDA
jgi:pteridine reductase